MERHTEPEVGVAMSETDVTDKSVARRLILPLISADEQANHGNLDTLSICVSYKERRQNSGFMLSENASEYSYASSTDNRLFIQDGEGVKSSGRFQRY